MEKKILIVEDEPKVASFIKQGLEENNYFSEIAVDGQEGFTMSTSKFYDLIILDINLPYINGIDLCKEIRKHNTKVPIIMLTAMGGTDFKLSGFDSGADDYLVKPFEFKELLARIKALIKRTTGVDDLTSNILKISDLEMNLDTKVVKRSGQKIELTAKEFTLLEFLIRNKGRVLSRATIAEKVWDITFDTGTNVIDVYVNFLRKKVDKDFPNKLIHTQVGMGYVIKDPDTE